MIDPILYEDYRRMTAWGFPDIGFQAYTEISIEMYQAFGSSSVDNDNPFDIDVEAPDFQAAKRDLEKFRFKGEPNPHWLWLEELLISALGLLLYWNQEITHDYVMQYPVSEKQYALLLLWNEKTKASIREPSTEEWTPEELEKIEEDLQKTLRMAREVDERAAINREKAKKKVNDFFTKRNF